MDFIIDAIVEWLKGLLVDGIMGNLDGLFDNVNQSVGEIATQVGTTPADWNAGVFSMIRQISETAILPIAGVILTFVMTYELIQMLIERNNLHEVDTWMFFKWVFKTFVAVMILTNTFNIVLAVFDVSQHVIQQSAGIIQNGTEITPDVLGSLRTELEAMELGPLFGLWLQSFLIQLTMIALNIVIFVIVYGRMIEIYLLTSLAPIPFATVPNRETGHMGQNYFRSLFAVGFQGLLILVCVAIYAVLIQSIATDGDPIGAIWGCVGYTVLLCFTLFKTGSLLPLAEQGKEPPKEVTPEPEPKPTEPVEEVPESEPEKKDSPLLSLLLIGAVVLAGGGIGYYFKIYKPKHEAPDLEDDYCEYEDGELEEISEEPDDEDTPRWEEDTEE